jgi:hypothetical protein
MLCGALKQANCLRGIVMVRIVVRHIGFKGNIGDCEDVSCLKLRLAIGVVMFMIAASGVRVMPMVVAGMVRLGKIRIS